MSGTTNFLAFLGYLACLTGITPVAALAIFFFFVKQAARFEWGGSLGGLIVKLLEFFLEAPGRIVTLAGIAFVILALLVALGARESWRGYGLAGLAVAGVVSIAYISFSATNFQFGQALFLLPSSIACVVSGYWALRHF